MKRFWTGSGLVASAMAYTPQERLGSTIYTEAIGPLEPPVSRAAREKPEGRAAARRRRQMAKNSEDRS